MIKLTVHESVEAALKKAFPKPAAAAKRALAKYISVVESMLFGALQRGQCQYFLIFTKPQNVAQQLAFIGVGKLQGVSAILVNGTFLLGVPLLSLNPSGTNCAEFQLSPV